jgi:hypothetical protein
MKKHTVLHSVTYVNYKGEVIKPLQKEPVRDCVLKKEFWAGVFMQQAQKRAAK